MFELGHPGYKPKGSVSKKVAFENFLFENFVANKDKAEELLNKMYSDKNDFKWVMNLLTERMPKESTSEVTNTDKKIIIEIDKSAEPKTNRVPGEILQE